MAETQTAQTRTSIRGKFVIWLAWVMGLGLAGFMLTMYFGKVTGEEFNPFTLSQRTFHYYEIPGLGIQVSPISRDTTTGFAQVLVNDNLVKVQAKNEWHLVWASTSETNTERGDASILTQYIGPADSSWAAWSTSNPKSAKKFWPVALELARRNHYLLLPDVLDVASQTTDNNVAELADKLNESLVKQYIRAAKIQQASENDEEAAELIEFAQSYAQGNEELKSLVSDYEDDSE